MLNLQQLRGKLVTIIKSLSHLSIQRIGIILFLIGSVVLFFTVLLVALPSAKIKIWPTVSLVSHTANVVLVSSGTVLEVEPKHTIPLIQVQSSVNKTLNFKEISKKFLGENAEVEITLVNETDEPYLLRSGTRMVNQAGMIFKTLSSADIPAAKGLTPGTFRVQARAMAKDLYGQIIGERGNVPAGLKWEIPGLSLEERKLVYARNAEDASGGITRYGTELHEDDLELASRQIEQELISLAKERTEERVKFLREEEGRGYVVLQYDVLTSITMSGFTLPVDLIGKEVESVPVAGALTYTVLAYDKDALLDLLMPGLMQHVEEGRFLIDDSVVTEGISVHVIEYDDALAWVKITAELTGKQRSILAPTTRSGRAFTERVREMVKGKSVDDAMRILQNFPEVERVDISVWPPWRKKLPLLMSNIVIVSKGS